MNNKMNIPLSGIIPPLVTPLLDDDVLDVEGLRPSDSRGSTCSLCVGNYR